MENVSWYKISPTLHKILEHGSLVLQLFPDSITSGMLSEEPAEASNKTIKGFQLDHSRQDTPQHRNLDVFHRQIDSSDPRILSYFERQRKLRRKSEDVFPNAVLALCKDSTEIEAEFSLQ